MTPTQALKLMAGGWLTMKTGHFTGHRRYRAADRADQASMEWIADSGPFAVAPP